ncbi:hypothetical protein BKA70DRAFT_1297142 [Coprinopsis sp. MPI-PUGE-AT-0042]|nr:hypothetical protein BKA70DRAFT_1297142 [Coprinopsis sp. MPI-PUGE-AT-0042]
MELVGDGARASIDALAHETLSDIFLYCMHPVTSIIDPSVSHPPLKLTVVCQRWRSIAFATPGLWASACITLGPVRGSKLVPPKAFAEFERVVRNQKEGAMRWLTLAGDTPTHIQFHIINTHDLMNISFYVRNQAMKLVLECLQEICAERFSKKWETLSIGGSNAVSHPYRNFFLSIPKEHLSSLKSLSYSFHSPTTYPAEQEQTLRFRDLTFRESGIASAPSLQVVHLTGLSVDDRLTSLPIPWSQITNLTLAGGYWPVGSTFSADDVLSIIKVCALTLRALCVEVGANSNPLASASLTQFPNLERLVVAEMSRGGEEPFHLQDFMASLSTPRLQELRFETGCSPEYGCDGEVSPLLVFAQVHRANLLNLTHLAFEYNYLCPAELMELFDIMGAPEMGVTNLKLEATWVSYRDMGGTSPYATLDDFVLERFNPSSGKIDAPIKVDVLKDEDSGEDEGVIEEKEHCQREIPLFPKLVSLYVRLAKEEEFIDQDLLTFLRPRLQRHSTTMARLTSVWVGFVSEETIDVVERLQGMEDVDLEGVDIEINYEEDCIWANI